ncbi:MAG: lipopolysaccharide biosynthesis protein [Deltaproteobacteria bacterium]|nr:MAG: lipopolysaccharide biosynthesis protein [Deltaproteobacteria bacterium]
MNDRMVASAALPALSLRVNFGWTLAGTVLYAACQWAMLSVLAKLTSPEEVGHFALGLAVAGPIFILSGLQLRAIQATDARGAVRFSDYLAVRIAGSALGCCATLAIAVLGRFPYAGRIVLVGMAVAKSVESLSDVLYGLFQQRERMDRIAHSLAMRGMFALALLAAGVWLGRTAAWGVLGIIIAWTAVLVLQDLPGRAMDRSRAPDLRTRNERARDRRRVVMTGLPLGIVLLLVSLNFNIPRYFLQASRGERELGIFAALASTVTAGLVVVNALGQSASPRLARLAVESDRAGFVALLWKLLATGTAIGVAGVLAAIFIGRDVVALLFTAEYAAHQTALVALMIGAAFGFVASFLGYAMTALRAFRVQVPLFVPTCAITAIWASLDVPRAGVLGAARAMIASAIVQLIGSAIVVARRLPEARSR